MKYKDIYEAPAMVRMTENDRDRDMHKFYKIEERYASWG